MEPQKVMLATICEGAVEERFAEKLQEVLANIEDPNTQATKAREITIKVKFHPSEERDVAAVGLSVEAKLQPSKPMGSTVFIGRKDGKLMAIESNPKQHKMFNDEGGRPVPVPNGAQA